MLAGKELGKAIRSAIEKKKVAGVSQVEIAGHFGVKPQSIQTWMTRGAIGKEKLPELWDYFSDVVGPEHWGLKEYAHHSINSPDAEWPFVGIELKRVTKLGYDQKLEIQGAIRLLLTAFESKNRTNVRKIRHGISLAK